MSRRSKDIAVTRLTPTTQGEMELAIAKRSAQRQSPARLMERAVDLRNRFALLEDEVRALLADAQEGRVMESADAVHPILNLKRGRRAFEALPALMEVSR